MTGSSRLVSSELDRRRRLVLVGLGVALSAYYVLQVSAWTFRHFPTHTGLYDLLAEGFLRGQLHLVQEPAPKLLASPNPSARANMPLWLWDATFYGKHYYLYFGPVPALLLAAAKALTFYSKPVGDQWLTLVFMLGRLYAGGGLMLALARRMPSPPPFWATALAIAVFGLSHPTPFLLARAAVYEAAIAAGQFWVVLGLYCALRAVAGPEPRAMDAATSVTDRGSVARGLESGRIWLVSAGVCWGLALGSRISLIFAIAPMMLATLAMFRSGGARRMAMQFTALAAPVAFALASLAAYNYARFGRVTEFGTTYQLTTMRFVLHPRNIGTNLYTYLFRTLDFSCEFPFVWARWAQVLPAWVGQPRYYSTLEPVTGLLAGTPWCWLLVIAAGRALRKSLGARRGGQKPKGGDGAPPVERWAMVSLGLLAVLGAAPVLLLWTAEMRYLEDVLAGVLLGSTLAGWALLRATAGGHKLWRYAARATYVALAVASLGLGVLPGLRGPTSMFERENPVVYRWLKASLSMCRPQR